MHSHCNPRRRVESRELWSKKLEWWHGSALCEGQLLDCTVQMCSVVKSFRDSFLGCIFFKGLSYNKILSQNCLLTSCWKNRGFYLLLWEDLIIFIFVSNTLQKPLGGNVDSGKHFKKAASLLRNLQKESTTWNFFKLFSAVLVPRENPPVPEEEIIGSVGFSE